VGPRPISRNGKIRVIVLIRTVSENRKGEITGGRQCSCHLPLVGGAQKRQCGSCGGKGNIPGPWRNPAVLKYSDPLHVLGEDVRKARKEGSRKGTHHLLCQVSCQRQESSKPAPCCRWNKAGDSKSLKKKMARLRPLGGRRKKKAEKKKEEKRQTSTAHLSHRRRVGGKAATPHRRPGLRGSGIAGKRLSPLRENKLSGSRAARVVNRD